MEVRRTFASFGCSRPRGTAHPRVLPRVLPRAHDDIRPSFFSLNLFVDRPRYVRAEHRSAWFPEQHQADNDAFSWTEPREEAASSGDDDDDGDGDGDGDRDARAVDDGSGSDDSTPPPAKSSKAAGAHKPGKVGGKGQRGEHKQARRNVLDDDDDDGEDDNSVPVDAKPPPPSKPRKAAVGARKPGNVGGKGHRGEHKQARRNVLDDDDEDGEDDDRSPDDAKPPPPSKPRKASGAKKPGKAAGKDDDGDESPLEYDEDRKRWKPAAGKVKGGGRPRREKRPPAEPQPPPPPPEKKASSVKAAIKKRAKDPDKYSPNVKLAGFTDHHEDAELNEFNGNQYHDGAITKRERAINALIANEYFAHLELFKGAPGTVKPGALIHIPVAERRWLERYAVPLPPLGVFVHAAPIHVFYHVSYHVTYHVSFHVPMMTYARLLS